MKKRLLLIVVLLAAAAAGIWHFQGRPDRSADVLRFSGNVDIREVNLGFRVPGRLAEVLKEEGEEVRAGELLAHLDREPFLREVEEARARVGAARAQLELLEAGHRPEEIAQARAVVREREATRANAERVYRRQEDLLADNAVAIQERDDAQARFNEADARLLSAREQLRLLEAGFRIEEVAAAQAELARAEAALAGATLRLEDTALKAPSDGVVLTRAQEAGAILAAGTPVFTISLNSPVWVRAYVSEPQLGRLRPGMPMAIYTDSAPDQPYLGHVGYISPRAEFTPKQVETAELRTSLVYRFRVVVENPDAGLRQGMPVTVRPK
jgi:HlyD family secretion protein